MDKKNITRILDIFLRVIMVISVITVGVSALVTYYPMITNYYDNPENVGHIIPVLLIFSIILLLLALILSYLKLFSILHKIDEENNSDEDNQNKLSDNTNELKDSALIMTDQNNLTNSNIEVIISDDKNVDSDTNNVSTDNYNESNSTQEFDDTDNFTENVTSTSSRKISIETKYIIGFSIALVIIIWYSLFMVYWSHSVGLVINKFINSFSDVARFYKVMFSFIYIIVAFLTGELSISVLKIYNILVLRRS